MLIIAKVIVLKLLKELTDLKILGMDSIEKFMRIALTYLTEENLVKAADTSIANTNASLTMLNMFLCSVVRTHNLFYRNSTFPPSNNLFAKGSCC